MVSFILRKGVLLATICAADLVSGVSLDVNNADSIKSAASTIAYGLVKYYTGNVTNTPETIAMLPPPHYWWQSGAMWGLLVDYYHLTGDSSYNAITSQALESQMGPEFDYMVPLRANQEANDDQAFWGFSTMSAAEKGYPEPSFGGYTWLQLTENLWNTQVRRWDTTQCGGGLKWQIFETNAGYNYKNSVSNGAFFHLSARLARFTGNQTYADWAIKSWDWSESVGLISGDYSIFDGTDALKACKELNHIEWSYNLGIYLYGAAMLYDFTNGADQWKKRTQGLLDASAFFFSPYENSTNIMYEYGCEQIMTCNYDQFSFKGYLARFMWATTLVAPFTKSAITTLLQTSAQAAAQSCSGGSDGVTCGTKWYVGGWDGTWGAGQQMSALETIQGLLIANSAPPIRRVNTAPEPIKPHVEPQAAVPPPPAPAPEELISVTYVVSTSAPPVTVSNSITSASSTVESSTLESSTSESSSSTSSNITSEESSTLVSSSSSSSASLSQLSTTTQVIRVRPSTSSVPSSTVAQAATSPTSIPASAASKGGIDWMYSSLLFAFCFIAFL